MGACAPAGDAAGRPGSAGLSAPPPSDLDPSAGVALVDGLLVAAGRGDGCAFGELYDRTVPLVFVVLARGLGSSASAAAAAEELYLELWRAAPQFDPTRRCAYAEILHAVHRYLAN